MTRTFVAAPSWIPTWSYMKRRPLVLAIGVLILISFGLFVRHRGAVFSDLPPLTDDLPPLGDDAPHKAGKYWSSFAQLATIFVFGDSWSSLSFKICPYYEASEASYFGHPDFPGVTTTNGPNWIGYLTHVFNRSTVSTYDFAIAGTAVESSIVPGWAGWDFKTEIGHLIGDDDSRCRWAPQTWDSTSLFTVFFGMNDITGCDETNQCDIYNPPIAAIFESYTDSIVKLYDAGARNFLLLNAPPIDAECAQDLPASTRLTRARIRATKLFNQYHRRLAHNLRTNFADTTVFEFDVWGLFQQLYHNVQSVPDAALYRNLTDMCPTYGPAAWPNGTEVTQAEIDVCGGLRPEEYLWNSGAHVTWPVHKAIARGAAAVLEQYDRTTI